MCGGTIETWLLMMAGYYGDQDSSAIIGLKVAKPKRQMMLGGVEKEPLKLRKGGQKARYQGEENEARGCAGAGGGDTARQQQAKMSSGKLNY